MDGAVRGSSYGLQFALSSLLLLSVEMTIDGLAMPAPCLAQPIVRKPHDRNSHLQAGRIRRGEDTHALKWLDCVALFGGREMSPPVPLSIPSGRAPFRAAGPRLGEALSCR